MRFYNRDIGKIHQSFFNFCQYFFYTVKYITRAEIKINPAKIFFYSEIIHPTPADIRASRASLVPNYRWLRFL